MSLRRRKIQRLWQHGRQLSSESSVSTGEPFDAVDSVEFQSEISGITVEQLLELDPRPTFVLNLKPDNGSPFQLQPVFLNAALRADYKLCSHVVASNAQEAALPPVDDAVSSSFQSWMRKIPSGNAAPTFSCFNVNWMGYCVKQLVVISGQRDEVLLSPSRPSLKDRRTPSSKSEPAPESRPRPKRALTGNDELDVLLGSKPSNSIISFVTTGTPDWTIDNPQGELSPYIVWVRSIDWASTPLGPMSSWSPELRQVACLLMANPHPAAMFWGDELTSLYNQPYAEREAGNKHPTMMGTGVRGPFAEIWTLLDPIFSECRRTGNGFSVNDQLLPLERDGFLEETYYTWSLTPLYGGTQNLCGFYNAPFETTKQILNARALKTLLRLGHEMGLARSVSDLWPKILVAISENGSDFPFAVLYSVVSTETDSCPGLNTMESDQLDADNDHLFLGCCRLEGTIGVPEGHPAAPRCADLNHPINDYIMAFKEAMYTGEPILLSVEDGTLSSALLEDIEWGGFGEPCRQALVLPIQPAQAALEENVLGFLVIGLNPRRKYGEDFQSFIQLLHRQLATSLASVTLVEAEVRRSREAANVAALERTRLSEELAVERSRLQRVAEVSQVGMFSIRPDGLLLEANTRFFELTGHSTTIIYAMSWMETIHESSSLVAEDAWKTLTVDQSPWSGELRLKKASLDAVTEDEASQGTWILVACQPEFSNGELKSIMGSITEISRKKWAEVLQEKRLEEAEEIRRAQNNFIDITSHEMRNPLSAMIQCADGISSSINEVMQSQALSPQAELTMRECLSSAETIQLCAQHQKSIVDDILTISKLDSNLLLISPVAIRPIEIVRQALQMFLLECQKVHDIKLEFHVDASYRDLDVNTVMLDSSRLLQVLINLLSNSIKFTKGSQTRTIDVLVGAYAEPPPPQSSDFEYFPSPNQRKRELTPSIEWGNGGVVYLRFEVKDSGCGLKPEEKQKLFNRFTQASPRTHVQYGGSGLGLFISRQLTELQGGEIGVASEDGQGSSFAFYVKARRTDESEAENEMARKRVSWDVQLSSAMPTDVQEKFEVQEKFTSTLLTQVETPELDVSDWHVLIVEDNLVNQRILAQQMRKLGATVYVANHGGEALSLIQESKHFKDRETEGNELSVILMDLEMPVMDGLTCVRKIREMEAEGAILGHIPIIAVTANARDEQIALARNSGMDDVMPKPFRIVQIKAKIENLLKKCLRSSI